MIRIVSKQRQWEIENVATPLLASVLQSFRVAYCKTAATVNNEIVCYLDTDATGEEITVYCNISGGAALNTATPLLSDGDALSVWYDQAAEVWRAMAQFIGTAAFVPGFYYIVTYSDATGNEAYAGDCTELTAVNTCEYWTEDLSEVCHLITGFPEYIWRKISIVSGPYDTEGECP